MRSTSGNATATTSKVVLSKNPSFHKAAAKPPRPLMRACFARSQKMRPGGEKNTRREAEEEAVRTT